MTINRKFNPKKYNTKEEKIQDINIAAMEKDYKCKYCKQEILWQVEDIEDFNTPNEKIKWLAWDFEVYKFLKKASKCRTNKHYITCFPLDYEYKFKEGDSFLYSFKNKPPIKKYTIEGINEKNKKYRVKYLDKRGYLHRGAHNIKTIDKYAIPCTDLANVIFD